jgi:glutathione S-transferase
MWEEKAESITLIECSDCSMNCRSLNRSCLCLNEKGLDYKGIILDLRAGDQFRTEYRALNPNALVPTLVHDGVPIIESTVINEYLDEAFPDRPLRPDDPVGRARMRVWTKKPDEIGHSMSGAFGFALSHRHLIKDQSPEAIEAHLAQVRNPAQRERERQSIALGLEAPLVAEAALYFAKLTLEMEAALSTHMWLAGDRYSLADIALTPYITRLDDMGMSAFWDGRAPRVADWYARIHARSSHRQTIYDEGNPEVFALLAENSQREKPMIDAMIARACSTD